MGGAAPLGGLAVLGAGVALLAAGWAALQATRPAIPQVVLPAEAALHVAVQPPAAVFVGGLPQGEGGDVSLEALSPGAHRVRLEAPGHLPWSGRVRLVAGGTTRLEQVLEPEPVVPPARLVLRSRPAGATVLVDGVPVGTTPLTWSTTTEAARSVQVTFRRTGFADARAAARLVPGAADEVEAVLVPAR